MAHSDKMLNCLVDSSECLYRVRRDADQGSKIVYVCVKDPVIIPEDERTYGPSLFRHLEKLPEWKQVWTTLTIFKEHNRVRCEADTFLPPALPEHDRPGDYRLYQITQLRNLRSFKERVSLVQLESATCILKTATFSHEVPWLAQEIKAYHFLARLGSNLVPKLLGYACEGDRIVGFLCETITGRMASINDLHACRKALRQLHNLGIVHGDVTKHNILITIEGPRFVDLEDSIIGQETPDFEQLKNLEIKNLETVLCDESGRGQPWTINGDL